MLPNLLAIAWEHTPVKHSLNLERLELLYSAYSMLFYASRLTLVSQSVKLGGDGLAVSLSCLQCHETEWLPSVSLYAGRFR